MTDANTCVLGGDEGLQRLGGRMRMGGSQIWAYVAGILGACSIGLVPFAVGCTTGGWAELDAPQLQPIAVDSANRTVTSAKFFLAWSVRDLSDPEELDILRWAGQPNITNALRRADCGDGDVEYFGNSWAPPDPQIGGPVLVGGGTSGIWQPLSNYGVKISSAASGCGPAANVPVTTTYRFGDHAPAEADMIRITRTFHFGKQVFARSFRPYIARPNDADFNRVLHPDQSGTALVSENVFACPYGCEVSNWNGAWFAAIATAGPRAGQGFLALRRLSPFSVALWVDFDTGSATNASSVIVMPPTSGFAGDMTETEALCFFDSTSWPAAQQARLVLPTGCSVEE
jgi:hypothetical protein